MTDRFSAQIPTESENTDADAKLSAEENTNIVQEVVLQYVHVPKPVVLQYTAPECLPDCEEREDKWDALLSFLRHGIWPPLAIVSLIVTMVSLIMMAEFRDNWFRAVYGEGKDSLPEKNYAQLQTDIPTYPTGNDVRLVYEAASGEVLGAQQIYEKVLPSVVTIIIEVNGGVSIGTGIIYTDTGFIVTNAHVVAGGSDCSVLLSSGRLYGARLVAMDHEYDLAVLKLSADVGETFPAAVFGDSDSLRVGDPVYAIGNPLGMELRGTMTDGIVSAIERDVSYHGMNMPLIQTNAALNEGNSGGPLINQYGQIVGINTMKLISRLHSDIEGLGFAIPISSIVYMVNDLVTYGEVRDEPVLGLSVQTKAQQLDDGTPALLVLGVTKGGGGEKADIRIGDLLVTANGESLSSTYDLLRIRRRFKIGERVRLLISRDGVLMEKEVKLAGDSAQ